MAKELLPDSVRNENTEALASLISGPGSEDMGLLIVNDIDNCRVELLPLHTERLGMQDFITPGLPEASLRQLLKSAREFHRYSGTRYAVRRSLESLGINAVITEWWEKVPQGDPYTFSIVAFVNNNIAELEVPLSADTQNLAIHLVQAVNRASVTFDLSLGMETNTDMKLNGGVRAFQSFRMVGVL